MDENRCFEELVEEERGRYFVRFTYTGDYPHNPLQDLFTESEVRLEIKGFSPHAIEAKERRTESQHLVNALVEIYGLTNALNRAVGSFIWPITKHKEFPDYDVCIRLVAADGTPLGGYQAKANHPVRYGNISIDVKDIGKDLNDAANYMARLELFEKTGEVHAVSEEEEGMGEEELLEKFAEEEAKIEEYLDKAAKRINVLLKAYYAFFGWLSRALETVPIGLSAALTGTEKIKKSAITRLLFVIPQINETLKEEFEYLKESFEDVSIEEVSDKLTVTEIKVKSPLKPILTKDSPREDERKRERKSGQCSGYVLEYDGEPAGLGKGSRIRYIGAVEQYIPQAKLKGAYERVVAQAILRAILKFPFDGIQKYIEAGRKAFPNFPSEVTLLFGKKQAFRLPEIFADYTGTPGEATEAEQQKSLVLVFAKNMRKTFEFKFKLVGNLSNPTPVLWRIGFDIDPSKIGIKNKSKARLKLVVEVTSSNLSRYLAHGTRIDVKGYIITSYFNYPDDTHKGSRMKQVKPEYRNCPLVRQILKEYVPREYWDRW